MSCLLICSAHVGRARNIIWSCHYYTTRHLEKCKAYTWDYTLLLKFLCWNLAYRVQSKLAYSSFWRDFAHKWREYIQKRLWLFDLTSWFERGLGVSHSPKICESSDESRKIVSWNFSFSYRSLAHSMTKNMPKTVSKVTW